MMVIERVKNLVVVRFTHIICGVAILPMDPPLTPPARIQVLSTTPISTKTTQKRLQLFLDDFQARNTSAQGGNTAVTVQLQKLADALKEERKKGKKQ